MPLRNEDRAVKYLVTEDDGTTHLPYTGEDGKADHKLMGSAWAALHGGYRGEKYAGPDKAGAIERLKAVYKSEKMDTPDEKKSAPNMDERRAVLVHLIEGRALTEDEICRTTADESRALSVETQASLKLIQQCRAACYALMSYLCSMSYDAFPGGVYTSIYECYACCDLCLSLIGRESVLSSGAHELCSVACRQVVTVCAGTDDAILQACIGVCGKTADSSDAMAAPGESEEGRAARKNGDEIRSFKSEFRSSEGRKVVGYPILFNSLSQDLGGYRERILPDAVQFDDDLRADYNHSPDYILGRCKAGTLRCTVDAKGVRMEADAPDTTWARDLMVSMDRGDVDQGSFAFRVLPGGAQLSDENGQSVRTLSKILVRKLSVVSDPAYIETSMQSRSTSTEHADEVRSEPSNPPVTVAVDGDNTQVRDSSTSTEQTSENGGPNVAPPAFTGGGGISHLRRKLDLAGL